MKRFLAINNLRWHTRWPVKILILAMTVMLVCYPYPARMVRHFSRWQQPNSLIDANEPSLQPWLLDLAPKLEDEMPPRQALATVERFVYDKLPYAWDWETWGTVDYIPTVAEAIAMGKEDCDGRAVVAASMLTHFGYKAQLVTDFTHVWVKTEKGETMGPRKKKAVVATPQGLKVEAGAWRVFLESVAPGLAVFPLGRQLIVIFVLWLLNVRRRVGAGVAILTLALLVDGLLLARASGAVKAVMADTLMVAGVLSLMTGLVGLWWRGCNRSQPDGGRQMSVEAGRS